MPVETIRWVGRLDGWVELVDQTLLPGEFTYVTCETPEQVWEAIRALRVRGAPAIGIAAAMGLVLGVRDSEARDFDAFMADLIQVRDCLATSRPTAVNLFWALQRMERTARDNADLPIPELKQRLLDEALRILEEDKDTCRRIGRRGAELLRDGDTVLTHCNAGGLATADYGTAVAVLFAAKEQGKHVRAFADETRPLLQGARLTTWELRQAGIPVTLICDSTAAQVMKEGRVSAVVVGADRIAANGDTANKIGTYGLSVLAREHGIPFYVAAPASTFDLSLRHGSEIPIEQRDAEEVTRWGGRATAPDGIEVYNPAFDVTPAKNITAIITERGVIREPNAEKIARLLGGGQ
ncbi:MAG: methylthioribose-1-phosphate isomerase [Planctomycetes bacterium SM23_32]|nr:MAG: methylthioribose-1-phosphate isomerase [Planctomycetes bacterium SM23_32]